MARREKRYHFLYKTTNLINGKYYIGMHSTDDLKDGYLGSGKRLRYSIGKYGAENFKREVLEFFEDRKQMAEREAQLVNEKLLLDPMCMNINPGGQDGWSEYNKKNNAIRNAKWNKLKPPFKGKKHGPGFSEKLKAFHIDSNPWRGKSHSEETKMKMKKVKNVGESNSQFGSFWITNGIENKKAKSESEMPEGWTRGRTSK